MAVISGMSLGHGLAKNQHRRRIVIRFKPDVLVPYQAEAFSGADSMRKLAWNTVRGLLPGSKMLPYFDAAPGAALAALSKRVAKKGLSMLERFFVLECPLPVDLAPVIKLLNQFSEIEVAYAESGPVPPPVTPGNDSKSHSQRYLDPAPGGIDARFAWSKGLDGSGVGFVDVEQGWTLDHEDLAAAGISLISGVNYDYFGHGTAVLGQVRAVDNSTGCIGIAPGVSTRVVSQFRTPEEYLTAAAILDAAAVMNPGDVLLLEAQTWYGQSNVNWPVEVEDAVCAAIQHATAMGIIVVEAGGNGSADLDGFEDEAGRRTLNRSDPNFRDSGAILVGAASASVPHRRLPFSNYGSRVDCFGWGEAITTLGDGQRGNGRATYTEDFGGTSGASPIVAGAALLVQAERARSGALPLSPSALRDLLSSRKLNTSSGNPPDDRVGVMPDLRNLLQSFS